MHSERTNLRQTRQSGGSGFQTLDSRIRSVIQIAIKIVSLGPWAMPYPYRKFRQNPFTSLRVIQRTDRQTDRQIDGQRDRQTDWTKNITFFGGGNNYITFQCNLPLHQYTSDICRIEFLCHVIEIQLRGLLELVVIEKPRSAKVLLQMLK